MVYFPLQFEPEKLSVQIVAWILIKDLMAMPAPEFNLCLFLIPEHVQMEEQFKTLIVLSHYLETARFGQLWDEAAKNPNILDVVPAIQMAYNLLSKISPASKHWTICARVSRLWEYRGNVDDAEIQHLDLVLIDEQEEHIYTFSRFLVSSNKAKYMAVDSNYMIEIGYYSQIEERFDATPDFPMYAYSLIPFENLANYIGETIKFLDVIGVVVSVSNAASIQGPNQSSPATKRLVVIKNARKRRSLRRCSLPLVYFAEHT